MQSPLQIHSICSVRKITNRNTYIQSSVWNKKWNKRLVILDIKVCEKILKDLKNFKVSQVYKIGNGMYIFVQPKKS